MSDYLLTLVDSLATRNGGLVVGQCPDCCGGTVCGSLCCGQTGALWRRCGWPKVAEPNVYRFAITGSISGAYSAREELLGATYNVADSFTANMATNIDLPLSITQCPAVTHWVGGPWRLARPGLWFRLQFGVTLRAGLLSAWSGCSSSFYATQPSGAPAGSRTLGMRVIVDAPWVFSATQPPATAGTLAAVSVGRAEFDLQASNDPAGSHPSGPPASPYYHACVSTSIGAAGGVPSPTTNNVATYTPGTFAVGFNAAGCSVAASGGGYAWNTSWDTSGFGGAQRGASSFAVGDIALGFGLEACCGGDSLPDGSPDLVTAHDAMMRGAYGRPCQGCG